MKATHAIIHFYRIKEIPQIEGLTTAPEWGISAPFHGKYVITVHILFYRVPNQCSLSG